MSQPLDRRQFLGTIAALPLLQAVGSQQTCPCHNTPQCRYLGLEDGQTYCLKLDPKCRSIIDEEVAFLKELNALEELAGFDKLPLGDHCEGRPPGVPLGPPVEKFVFGFGEQV